MKYYRKMKFAFTMIELILVIVIMGIVGKYGTEILLQAYNYYIMNVTQNRFQMQSQTAVEEAATRLQYRIPETLVVRQGANIAALNGAGSFIDLARATPAGAQFNVLEWIGYDIDGWRGDGASTLPTWSGVIDVDNAAAIAAQNYVESPASDTGRIAGVINSLSTRGATAAITYIGDKNINLTTGYGWDNVAMADQTDNIHPIVANGASVTRFNAGTAAPTFAGTNVYEYYRLTWSAYALVHDNVTHQLWLYYDYRPWLGENLTNANREILMENVDTFQFRSIGDAMKLQICIKDASLFNITAKEYAVCSEKTIF
ncbi:MAG: type II secretion system protein [Sulfuricurvum sp.]|nr:type II secretion system protein [Sulfuricurvum sp.]